MTNLTKLKILAVALGVIIVALVVVLIFYK